MSVIGSTAIRRMAAYNDDTNKKYNKALTIHTISTRMFYAVPVAAIAEFLPTVVDAVNTPRSQCQLRNPG